jgi:hypothetical protein
LVCREENTEQLLAHLATHALDVVLADTPAPPHIRVKAFNHVLGDSETGSSHHGHWLRSSSADSRSHCAMC